MSFKMMKSFVAGDLRVAIQYVPNHVMVLLHTNFDMTTNPNIHAIGPEGVRSIFDSIPGVTKERLSFLSSRYQYETSFQIGELFDRDSIAEQAARKLLEVVAPEQEIQEFDKMLKQYTVIGAYNNYCSYGPTMNNDGEIKLEKVCVMAINATDAIKVAQALIQSRVIADSIVPEERYDVLDQPVAFEGNPLGLNVEV